MNNSFAHIVLFAYNRPIHVKKVLDALSQNLEAKNSVLHIFCDGIRKDANYEFQQKIIQTRNIVKLENRFLDIIIKEHNYNKGLANSIIDGVTEIINKYGAVIVIEDDIVPSKGFLKYMNEALNLYKTEPQVGCIHAWNYGLNASYNKETTFFLKGADCWGWATWKRAWDEFNPDGKYLLKMIEKNNLGYEFDRKNTIPFLEMLKNQIEGKNDSWAIRWHASLFIKNMFCLYPIKPLVKNIGLDNSGFHCGDMQLIQNPVKYIDIKKIPIEESNWFIPAYSDFIKKSTVQKKSKWQRLKTYLKLLSHQ